LKERFTKELVIVALDLDNKMRIEFNVSDYAIGGGVLLMEYEDSRWRLVVCLPKLLNEMERNYKIHNKKMLVVIQGLENWRRLLEDAKFKFKIQTENKNLEYFVKAQRLNCRQARWALYLFGFDFTLKHVPEMKMEKIDGLSRRLYWKMENDNENQKLIKKE